MATPSGSQNGARPPLSHGKRAPGTYVSPRGSLAHSSDFGSSSLRRSTVTSPHFVGSQIVSAAPPVAFRQSRSERGSLCFGILESVDPGGEHTTTDLDASNDTPPPPTASHHRLSLSLAAKQYGERFSAVDSHGSVRASLTNVSRPAPAHLPAASPRRRSADYSGSANEKGEGTQLSYSPSLETSERHSAAVNGSLSDKDAVRAGSGAATPAVGDRQASSRFAANFKHKVEGLSTLNSNRVGFSPVTDAALELAGVLGSRRLSTQQRTANASTDPARGGPVPIIRIPATSHAPHPHPQKRAPSLVRSALSPSPSPSPPTGRGTHHNAVTVKLALDNPSAAPHKHKEGEAEDCSSSKNDETPFSASGCETSRESATGEGAAEDLTSLSLSWGKVQQLLAMRAVEEEENRVYVPEHAGTAPGGGGGGGDREQFLSLVARGMRPSIIEKRRVLIKKPVLLNDSFLDDDDDGDDNDNDDDHSSTSSDDNHDNP